jgi:XTP/dITP diphosphohydrolase
MSSIPSVVIATHNCHKLREIKKILGRLPFVLKTLEDFPPPTIVRETGKTLEANALLKARAAVRRTKQICLSDDTGLEVRALGGAPGVISARFAGPRCSFDDNNRKLLRLLAGVPLSQRTAVFRCVVAVVFPDGREKLFEGRCPGRIPLTARGSHGFGYDPLFEPREVSPRGPSARGSKHTFAEMPVEKKNRLSHRAKAFRKAGLFLKISGV